MKRFWKILASALWVMTLITLFRLHSSSATAFTNSATPVYSWVEQWGGANASVMAKYVKIDAAGNIYIVGEFQGTVNFDPAGPNPSGTFTSLNGTTDAYLTKFDSSGHFQWARAWGSGPTGGNIKVKATTMGRAWR